MAVEENVVGGFRLTANRTRPAGRPIALGDVDRRQEPIVTELLHKDLNLEGNPGLP